MDARRGHLVQGLKAGQVHAFKHKYSPQVVALPLGPLEVRLQAAGSLLGRLQPALERVGDCMCRCMRLGCGRVFTGGVPGLGRRAPHQGELGASP